MCYLDQGNDLDDCALSGISIERIRRAPGNGTRAKEVIVDDLTAVGQCPVCGKTKQLAHHSRRVANHASPDGPLSRQ